MIALVALTLVLCCCSTLHAEPAADEQGFVPLMQGDSIDGWVKRGGDAQYSVEDGAIVGTSKPHTPNTFLCTPRDYSDFELRLELKVEPPLNSGIQIRSEAFDQARTVLATPPGGEQREYRIPAGRVHGYQVEIDPSDRAWSGGIYDEARRGWLYNLQGDDRQAAREAFKPDDWNEYRIRAEGDHLQTWVNGVPVADLHDDQTASGFIGLQVHSIGGDQDKIGKTIRWRNLRIKEL